ncbi:MarR family winged helix-turn-helix transcriptional regulator [Nocardia farcinica]|uniref:MarR family winged helix-turn-helix transcriptional regulator n=1 Tax=Nocardia farcinica TaxID=37329 RepID=UPI002458C8FF|nr:MarR family transcriptional regulator [Nocardia farcinica]
MVAAESPLALALRDALRPLWRQLTAHRTISTGKLGVLAYLAEHGPATSATLAAAEKISPQAIANAVRELEALGLIARAQDEHDRRKVWVSLTETGRQRLVAERSYGNEWLEQAIAERLTPDEVAILAAAVPVLGKLTQPPVAAAATRVTEKGALVD